MGFLGPTKAAHSYWLLGVLHTPGLAVLGVCECMGFVGYGKAVFILVIVEKKT